MRLLLADDDCDQLELRSLALAREGHEIRTAHDAETALQLAAEFEPEMAIVDLKLPTQDAGLTLIRELKRLHSRLRVVVLTGSDPKKLASLPEHALVEAVLTKGNASRQLLQHLKKQALSEMRRKLAESG